MTPRYKHDCDICTFIGMTDEYDLYVCPQAGRPTIIGRFGNEGPEYVSGDGMVVLDTPVGRVKLSFEKPEDRPRHLDTLSLLD